MRLIIRTLSLLAVWCCCGLSAPSQEVQTQDQNKYANDPCGDPTGESTTWTGVEGTVVKVIDGDTLIISLENKKHIRVHLIGIDAPTLSQPFGRDAQQLLDRNVGEKKVEVWITSSTWTSKRPAREITGVVYLREVEMQDANLSLVRAGLARHKESEPYTISSYTDCKYERAEEEARAAKRGLWQVAP